MQLELHQSSARRHHPIGCDDGPHGVLILPGLDNSGPRHWQSAWERLPHFKRVDFGEWRGPRLHDWVPRLDRAVRESPRPIVLVAVIRALSCHGCSPAPRVWDGDPPSATTQDGRTKHRAAVGGLHRLIGRSVIPCGW